MSSRVAGSVLLRHLGPRVFGPAAAAAQRPLLAGREGGAVAVRARPLSTSAAEAAREEAAASKDNVASTAAATAEAMQAAKAEAVQGREGGQEPRREQLLGHRACQAGEQGRRRVEVPWEAYTSDTTIDLTKHHKPKVLLDKIAYWTVKSLRVPTDIFFQRRYGCRAMMLETVAAVPGMVGGMLLHLRSLRRFEQSGGWIRALLEEAENERMHLMTFMEVANPKWYERALVLAVQGVFFNAYFVGYILSPKFAHRVVGYLEEEAIHSYTEFLRDLEAGRIDKRPPRRASPSTTGASPPTPGSRTSSPSCAPTRRTTATSTTSPRTSISRGWSSTRRLPRWIPLTSDD
ncbi:alternative oxidase [Hordeum vulgare]|nr:alternative oxidase [Hordeum vulgare]